MRSEESIAEMLKFIRDGLATIRPELSQQDTDICNAAIWALGWALEDDTV